MAHKPWEENFPQERIAILDLLLDEFLSDSVYWFSLFSHPEYSKLLSVKLSKFAEDNLYRHKGMVKAHISKRRKYLMKNRKRFDYLTKLIPAWIKEEEGRRDDSSISIGRNFGGYAKRKGISALPHDRVKSLEIHLSFQNILALSIWKHTVSELTDLAALGDAQSAFRLIELNNRFITADWFQRMLILSQAFDDKEFTSKLAAAIKIDSRIKYAEYAKIGVSSVLLWHLGFKDLPKKELLRFLRDKFGHPTQDIFSFNVYLNRLGLKKYTKR